MQGISLATTRRLRAQALTWTNFVNVAQTAIGLTKISGNGNAWDAGAFSVESIPANTNGVFEFMATESNTYKMMGLSAVDTNADYATIGFALHLEASAGITIYESGYYIGYFGQYIPSDVFSIERQGSTILYKKNGSVLYTSATSSITALFGDCSFYTPNGGFKFTAFTQPISIKTIDYSYDFLGNVTQVAYQKGQTDAFYHHYTYNADGKLTDLATSFDGSTKTTQARYKYYLHGPLKRVELATNLQGIDYVYTINGALKSINHTDVNRDPGGDGSNGFSADVFGQTLNYYANDYTGAGYNAGTFSVSGLTDYYGGLIKSASWFTPVDNAASKKMYGYSYDNLNRFTNAQWGTVTGTSGNYSSTLSATSYNENITGYDKNGNINGLNRKDKSGAVMGNYSYNYVANTNKLASVTGGADPVNYVYNTIGQMTQQTEGTLTMNIGYNAYGLTKEVRDGNNNLTEQFFYDDRGDLIKKTYFNVGMLFKTAWFVRDASGNVLATYEQNKDAQPALIELPMYGAGRVGMVKLKGGQPKYFYELNDHLGNVRTVIGSPSTDVFTATMEPTAAAPEDKQFKNIAPRITYAPANNTPGGGNVVRVNNGQPNGGYAGRIAGPGIRLTVAPGDIISAEVYAYYEGGSGYTSTLATSSIVAAAAAIFGGAPGPGDPGKIFNSFNTTYTTGGFVGGAGSSNSTIPAGYLNFIMFDGNLNASPTTLPMAAAPVTGAANYSKQKLTIGPINIPAPGYVYIYVNNNSDTPNWLYFDDLKVTQTHSPFVAGGDFYPFGLTMEDRQIKAERYRYGYQGQYSEKDSLTNLNEFKLRLYDARFGRWFSPDPYNQFSSPYNGMGNLPISAYDVDGGYIFLVNKSKRLGSFIKSLNRYYSTSMGKQMIDKYINDPHSHIELTISETRIKSKKTTSLDGETVSYAGAYTQTGNVTLLDQQTSSMNVQQGDKIAKIKLNGYDVHPASKQFSEEIGHEIEGHADFEFTFGKSFNENFQHAFFGSDKVLGSSWRSAKLSNSSAVRLAREVNNIKNKSIGDFFTTIALFKTLGLSQLVFKPTSVIRRPRYEPNRSGPKR